MAEVTKQAAMVMDLNKCVGCQTCTIACKTLWTGDEGMEYMWWQTVNTMPGKGTPKDWEDRDTMGGGFKDGKPVVGKVPTGEEFGEAWEFNHQEVFYNENGQGGSSYLRPAGAPPSWGPNWEEDVGGGTFPNSFFFYLPRICNHCTHPACMEACPRSAIYKREDDGIVLISESECEGYRFCMEACPYKKIYFNQAKKVSQKCIFCFPRIEEGVATACARQCPGHVRYVGYLDDPEGPIYKLVQKWKVALPLHPEYGTEPNVFYVPPIGPAPLTEEGKFDESTSRIPLEYLSSLFGPGTEEALATLKSERAKYREGEPSELMDLLISRRWIEQMGPFDGDPTGIASRQVASVDEQFGIDNDRDRAGVDLVQLEVPDSA
jgi:ethylbenzene hydroxylase subunit beta/complex iron-sulfur molybdoenzyme family reductase subunit beta